jgi:hypothetical protein
VVGGAAPVFTIENTEKKPETKTIKKLYPLALCDAMVFAPP